MIIIQYKYILTRLKTESHYKIKTGYYLELLTSKIMKLLRSTEINVTKDKNHENVPDFEIIEVASVQCNIVNNNYQQKSRVLYTIVPHKSFGSL